MRQVDTRIGEACAKACAKPGQLIYTRYVDDVTITGPFDLERSGIVRLVPRILSQSGFKLNPDKQETGRLSDGVLITKLRVKGTRIDVSKQYVQKLEDQLKNALVLAQGGEEIVGTYCTRGQIYGRIRFVCSINPGRRRGLLKEFKSIDWNKAVAEAMRRGLICERKRLEPKSPVKPWSSP